MRINTYEVLRYIYVCVFVRAHLRISVASCSVVFCPVLSCAAFLIDRPPLSLPACNFVFPSSCVYCVCACACSCACACACACVLVFGCFVCVRVPVFFLALRGFGSTAESRRWMW